MFRTKRVLAIIMAVLIMANCVVPMHVHAETNGVVYADDVVAQAGATVEVAVRIKNNPGICAMSVKVAYSEQLTLTKVTDGDILGEDMHGKKLNANPYNLTWNNMDDYNEDGTLVTLTFLVAENVAPGTVLDVVLSIEEDVYNINEDFFDFDTENGSVTVECEHTNKTEVPAKEAGCSFPGNHQYYTCDGCGAAFKSDGVTQTTVEAETIPALGHDWLAADCDTAKTCDRCGATEGEELGHSFTNYVSNNDATCTVDGTKTAKCDRCTETNTVTDAGSALGHDWQAADCDTAKTCGRCGETDGDPLGHSFTNYVSNNDATCTVDGTKTAKCDRCEETSTVTDAGSALGHDWQAADCDTAKTCARCGETEGEALGHDYAAEWSKGEDGHWHECVRCGDKTDEDDHDFGNAGDLCVNCGYERSHVHRLTLVPAAEEDCENAGNKAYYTCSGCENWFEDASGTVLIEDKTSVAIPALGHNFAEGICTRCGAKTELVSIQVQTMPNKTVYEVGELLDVTGLSLKLIYREGTPKIITAGYDSGYEIIGFDSSTPGKKVVTVTYQGKTAEFTVTVNEAVAPEDQIVLEFSEGRGVVGSVVRLKLYISNLPEGGISSLDLSLGYDPTQLKLTSVPEDGGILGEHMFGNNIALVPYGLTWNNLENFTTEGVILTLEFEILRMPEDGIIKIHVKGNECSDLDENTYAIADAEGIITRGLPGDVNGDGKISQLDVTRLRKYLAGGWGVEIDEAAADVNGDGKITQLDVTRLRKYLAGGWDVTLRCGIS